MNKLFFLAILFCAFIARAQDTVVPHAYHVVHYDVTMNINLADSSIVADNAIQLTSAADTLANVWLHLVGLTVDSVFVNGASQKFLHDSNYLFLALGSAMPSGTQFTCPCILPRQASAICP